ncbi:MAG: 4Fe-4S binding protein [Oscillospiraceae bacterium]|nr:4Fe-4S binding protein [Oscillospiraceae bacterium]
MEMVGISGVGRFAESPEGKNPDEILPGCKSVIVIGTSLLDGIVQVNFRAFEEGRRDLKGLYGTYGYATLPNFALTYACYAIGKYIETNTDAIATPLSTGPMTNGVQISLRHAAVVAGLGVFGWSGLLLSPEYGPRNRFGVILTTLEIEEDPMYDGPSLCTPEFCGVCVKVCPTNALTKVGEEPSNRCSIDGRDIHYARTDFAKCSIGTMGMRKETGGREDYVPSIDPTPEEFAEGSAKMPISPAGLQHQDSHHCGACLSYCPAGKWGERFKKTGLTKGLT